VTTSPGQVAGATQQAAGQTATTAKDEAVQVGQVAASAASDVAGTAKQQASQVAGEAVNQLRSLTDDARNQAAQQVSGATDKLSTTVRSFAGELRDLGQGKSDGSGTVAGLVAQLADKGEQLADQISEKGPGGLVQDLRSFAARKPGTFLLGALAAGVVTGRLVKGATAGSSTSGSAGTSGTYGTSGTAIGTGATYGSGTTYGSSTGIGTGAAYGTGTPTYETDLATTPAASVPPVAAASTSYLDDVPVAHSDDSGILDRDVDSAVGPVSGDARLRAETLESDVLGQGTYEPGTERR
jgi:hypothetical protein